MKRATKAALLSAFIFPGVGHVYLKKYIRGGALVGASFAAVYYLISTTVESAFQIVEKLQSGNAVLDMEAISELVAKQSIGAENHLINIASAVFVICWLIGIVDSYRAGWLQDKEP